MGLTGDRGSIYWGYQLASRVRAWTLAREGSGWRLTGRLETADAIRLAQRPLVFAVQRPTSAWRWPIRELELADGAVTARLGALERDNDAFTTGPP